MKDLSKLPKWARDEIERLRQNVEFHKRRADQIEGLEHSPVELRHFHGPSRHLSADSQVRFYVGEQCADQPWIECALRGGRLELYASHTLLTRHSSGNVCSVDVENY